MITIAKQFTFDAAHRLDRLPPEHKCHRMHGHTYSVEIQLHDEVDPDTGMLVDYDEIAQAWAPLHRRLDHHTLNDVEGLEVPTTEILVMWIFHHLLGTSIGRILHAVVVKESSTTWARIDRAGWLGHLGLRAAIADDALACIDDSK